jgi:DHA1 family bicyclomycin/chloramphenicol resistance-like MFS transporter
LLAALAGAGVGGVWAIVVPIWIFMLAHGVHQPCSQSGAVAPFPMAAGAASAWNGFVGMLTSFAVGGWIGTRFDGTAAVLIQGVTFWSICIAAVAWTLVQRHGEPAPR